jgi:hypothetical protein
MSWRSLTYRFPFTLFLFQLVEGPVRISLDLLGSRLLHRLWPFARTTGDHRKSNGQKPAQHNPESSSVQDLAYFFVHYDDLLEKCMVANSLDLPYAVRSTAHAFTSRSQPAARGTE